MNLTGRAVNRFIGRFQDRLGIARTRRVAKFYNGIRYRREQNRAIDTYKNHYDEWFLENDPQFSGKPRNILKDGWAIDRSGDFPYIHETLAEVDRLIEQRGGQDRRGTPVAQTDYLFHLNRPDDFHDSPGLLQFPMSSEVIATVSEYMGMIPIIAQSLPTGVRVFESTDRFNTSQEFDRSQLYHRDIHDMPIVYAILLARDFSEKNGPWCFLPASVSDRASRALNYQARGEPYRVTDERMYQVIDPSERIVFTGKRGDVLFLDSSLCFHYGSRRAVEPGYRVMYAFTTHCRSDFTLMLNRRTYPTKPDHSRLRKMVSGTVD